MDFSFNSVRNCGDEREKRQGDQSKWHHYTNKTTKYDGKLISAVVLTLQFCTKTQQTGQQRPNQYILKAEN